MNCLDFRRRWLTVPCARDLALAQHERDCSGCRHFARRGSVFERKLREALTVDAPAGLAERIRQRRDIGELVHERQIRPLRYALALGLLLLAVVASLLGYEFLAQSRAGVAPTTLLFGMSPAGERYEEGRIMTGRLTADWRTPLRFTVRQRSDANHADDESRAA